MTRVALLSSEPLRARMAGIGIRYLEMARALVREGFEVVLLSPPAESGSADDRCQSEAALGGDFERRDFVAGELSTATAGCSVVVAQGQLANSAAFELAGTPLVIDLYDPWLVENLHYAEQLGLDPYRNDHATWVLQMTAGDFFLCSSEEQRLYFLGFLTALGRVNPESIASDRDLERLIAVVPFGQPDELPPHRPILPPRVAGERRLLFGGLYDWYDPWPLLLALEKIERPDVVLYLVTNPNPCTTPQALLAKVERWCRERGYWQSRVRTMDWVPFERRYDLLRDFDGLVASHRLGLETRLSMRTRFLDALAVGVPVVTTEGGTISRLVAESRAGWVVPEADPSALCEALTELLDEAPEAAAVRQQKVEHGRELAARFVWQRVIEPLVRFCQEPQLDASKEGFVQSLDTRAPADPFSFRLKRKLQRMLGGRP